MNINREIYTVLNLLIYESVCMPWKKVYNFVVDPLTTTPQAGAFESPSHFIVLKSYG